MASKIRDVAIGLAIVLAVLAIGYTQYRAGAPPEKPRNPFQYTNTPFTVKTKQVKAGDFLEIEVGRCNYVSETVTYTVNRTIIELPEERTAANLEVFPVKFEPGCSTTLSRAHQIPVDVPPGSYRIDFLALVIYQGYSYTSEAQTEVFEVVP